MQEANYVKVYHNSIGARYPLWLSCGYSAVASIYYIIDYYATDQVSDTEYTLILHATKHSLNSSPEPIVMEFTFIRERDLWVCDASPSFRNCVLIHW